MTDPAIIEAAARVLTENSVPFTPMTKIAEAVLTAVTPMIEAAALERAAQFVENDYYRTEGMTAACDHLAAAIRALNGGVLIPPTNKQTPLSLTDNPLE